ncbi:MAG: histidine--tRNA ligase [Actinomycetota bacterium]
MNEGSGSLQAPRGTQDFFAPLSERFAEHERRSGELFGRAGYHRIITPAFEDTALFVRGAGEGSDIVNKEMYTFTDRSDNSLTLRPEGTAPVMRAIITNNLHQGGLPVKVWYSAAMFRYDRPKKGRYRQHHQVGLEVVGSVDPAVDAEVITLGKRMLEGAGITNLTLLLNSIGHPGCRADYAPRLKAFLESKRAELDADCQRRIDTNPLRVFDCKNERDQRILDDAPTIAEGLCDECREHFESVQGYLKELDVEFTIAPRLVRGLDYYTRTAFEFTTTVLEAAQSTVCGGGRYDALSEAIGGPSLPGIGFGSGIERVLIAQEASGAAVDPRPAGCLVIPISAEQKDAAVRLCWTLRDAGLSSDLPYAERGLKANMKHANRIGARFAAIIGPNDLASGVCTMRDLQSGEQSEISLEKVSEFLRQHQ